MKLPVTAAVALLLAACMPESTASIAINRAEAPVRQSCPAFRNGSAITVQSSRTYGAEQITNFENGSGVACRCVVTTATDLPRCAQVARSRVIRLEP
ncbi:MAG: hypothetical protein ACRC7G_15955 [Beijerinckiaceae bacterium]